MGRAHGVSVVAARCRGWLDLGAGGHLLFGYGAIWQSAVLTLFGVFVIGLVDNVLRPILVGKDTKCLTMSC